MDLYFTSKRVLTRNDIQMELNSAGERVYIVRDIEYFGNSEING